MDFSLSREEEAFRKEVEGFLQKEAGPEVVEESNMGLGWGPETWKFVKRLGSKGWLLPMFPKEYGGISGTWMQKHIVDDALDYFFFPEQFVAVGAAIVAPMLMMVGTEEQKREYVPRIARGEIEFALGYTEPEAGSDLANIGIRAVEDEDYFVINGQKIFNTGCHYSQYHWLCARTEIITPKHRGLSLFIVPMDSPGIKLTPIWAICGKRVNQVFYDNVRVPKKNLVGDKNRGFYHMMAAVDLERLLPTRHTKRAINEIVQYAKTTTKDGKPLSHDPLIRQKLAELSIKVEAIESLSYRVTWMLQNGKVPNYEAAVNKVFLTELEQDIAYTSLRIMGQYGQLKTGSKYAPVNGWFDQFNLFSARRTVAAGANEIQRTVIAQRSFDLPRS